MVVLVKRYGSGTDTTVCLGAQGPALCTQPSPRVAVKRFHQSINLLNTDQYYVKTVHPVLQVFRNAGNFFFFLFFKYRLSVPVGTPNLSMQVKIKATYLNPGCGFLCVWSFFIPP